MTEIHIPNGIITDPSGLWHLHSNPEHIIGGGIACERCGLLFYPGEMIEVMDSPLRVRHLLCNSERHINILISYARVTIHKVVDSRAWYKGLGGIELAVCIRSDRIAEVLSLAELAVKIGNPAIMAMRLRYIIYKGDYKIVHSDEAIAMHNVHGLPKFDIEKVRG